MTEEEVTLLIPTENQTVRVVTSLTTTATGDPIRMRKGENVPRAETSSLMTIITATDAALRAAQAHPIATRAAQMPITAGLQLPITAERAALITTDRLLPITAGRPLQITTDRQVPTILRTGAQCITIRERAAMLRREAPARTQRQKMRTRTSFPHSSEKSEKRSKKTYNSKEKNNKKN